jgi:large subunit ribosomal protein L31
VLRAAFFVSRVFRSGLTLTQARAMQCQARTAARPNVAARARKDIHPELKTAKIICSGEEVGEITGTQDKYVVDVWAGNHPFYRGDTRSLVLDEGQVRPSGGMKSHGLWLWTPGTHANSVLDELRTCRLAKGHWLRPHERWVAQPGRKA